MFFLPHLLVRQNQNAVSYSPEEENFDELVNLQPYLKNHMSELHKFSVHVARWSWLGPPLAALRYVIYVFPVLWIMSHFSHNGVSSERLISGDIPFRG